jgi:alpha-tubulin suppressor-like RCC1 family protein
MRQIGVRFWIFLTIMMIALAGCGDGQLKTSSTGDRGPIGVTVNVTGSTSDALSKTAFATVPSQVASVVLVVTDSSTSAELHTETANVLPGDTVTFNFTLPTGGNADFVASAYSGSDGAGTLLYEGSVLNVSLAPTPNLIVDINLGLVGTTPPTATTEVATGVAETLATLNGTVNPNGFEAAAYFEWGTDTLYGNTTSVTLLGGGAAPVAVGQLLNGLTAATTYHYRVAASSSGNLVYGSDQQFTTTATNNPVDVNVNFPDLLPPTVTTDPADGIGENTATLHATVNPEGSDTQFFFEYGTDTSYGATTLLQVLGNGVTNLNQTDNLTGLAAGTLYHFRGVAYNAAGVSFGADQSFTTGVSVGQVSAGNTFAMGLKPDGTVWSWGDNVVGQLGDGTTTNRTTPVQVCDAGETDPCANFLTGVNAVAGGGAHAVALKPDGTVWTWGNNTDGQLGDGTATGRTTPVQVCEAGETAPCANFLSNVIAVSAGVFHTMALKSDGTVWAWGDNAYGQLGNGSATDSSTPVQVCETGETAPCANYLSGVVAVNTQYLHSMALKNDGTVWTWGNNLSGQLGDGTTTDRSTPVQVCQTGSAPCTTVLSGISSISAGQFHSTAGKNDGTVWAWGSNSSGQLGNATATSSTLPVTVCDAGETSPCANFLSGVSDAAGGGDNTLARKNDGTVWAWGLNLFGNLGDGTTTDRTTPVQVCDAGETSPCTNFLSGVAGIDAAGQFSIAVKNDGTVWAWGFNGAGQLGDGTTTDRIVPVQVSGLVLN